MARSSEDKSIFLRTLGEHPFIYLAAKKVGIHPATIHRWMRSNKEFAAEVKRIKREGLMNQNEKVESVLLKQALVGNMQAVKFYLSHNDKKYQALRPIIPPPHFWEAQPEPVSMHPVPETLSDAEAYEQFVLWSALTSEERSWRGIQTREQFCKMYGVPSIRLLDAWAQRADFEQRVAALREDWIILKTGDLLGEIYSAARSGDIKSQTLWLDYARRIKEKRDATGPKPSRLSPDDVRQIIDMLPEALRESNYRRLENIRSDVVIYQNEQERKEREQAEIKERAERAAILESFKKPDGEIDWEAYSHSL